MNITQRRNLACATFTAAMLEEAEACQPQIDLFRGTFGESVVVTVARARKVSDQFDWGYAARFLDVLGRAEHDRVRNLARAEYERVQATAWAEYERVQATARAEYDRALATAWAEYERALAPAWAEYERVLAPAWASAYIATRKRAAAVNFAVTA